MTSAPLSVRSYFMIETPSVSGRWQRFIQRFEAWAQNRPAARAGRAYRTLSALSDAELAERGIAREDLALLCFGHLLYG
ncbi:MAG: hypothetical protein AAF409_10805 [Pseudomonadota bacterium]